MSVLDIGILALQGDVAENFMSTMMAMNELGIDGAVSQVKTPDQISAVDGLIVPGGESTMMGQLSMVNGAMNALKEKIEAGMPVLGICAGMILLAKNSKDRVVGSTKQPLLDVLDVEIERNSFGRQKDSCEAEVSLDAMDIPSQPNDIRYAASAGVAIPPAAKFTTGRRPIFAVSSTRSKETLNSLPMLTNPCLSPES